MEELLKERQRLQHIRAFVPISLSLVDAGKHVGCQRAENVGRDVARRNHDMLGFIDSEEIFCCEIT